MAWRELACDAETLLRRVLALAILLGFFTRTAIASESGSRDKRNAGHQKEKFSHKLTTLSSSRESQVPRAEKAGRIDCAEAAPQDQSSSSFSFLTPDFGASFFSFCGAPACGAAAFAAAVRVGLCLSGLYLLFAVVAARQAGNPHGLSTIGPVRVVASPLPSASALVLCRIPVQNP